MFQESTNQSAEAKSFIDDILQEAEEKESKDLYAHHDILIMEAALLESEIEENFAIADKEIEMIKKWALEKNSKLQEKLDFLKLKLEKFIRDEKLKTIDLPHGTLKLHKKPDKVEISDMEQFLAKARPEMMNVVPEQIKPDLTKIKAWIKLHGYAPEGVNVIEGKEEFSLKTKPQTNI